MSQQEIHIVLGVSGSISATKSQQLLIILRRKYGVHVRLAMTRSAQKFIGEMSLRGVLEEPPYLDLWAPPGGGAGEPHIEWGIWADAILIAPATASILSRLWGGLYDDPVTLVASTIEERRWFIAPGMSGEMWSQRAIQRNVRDLKEWGVNFLGPVEGQVASGNTGMRLMEPADIAKNLVEKLGELGLINRKQG